MIHEGHRSLIYHFYHQYVHLAILAPTTSFSKSQFTPHKDFDDQLFFFPPSDDF
jgi:hypothetical protein